MNKKELSQLLNRMERSYFFERSIGEASGTGYIAGSTLRGWRSSPKTPNAPKRVLVAAFSFLVPRFEAFITNNPQLDRSSFDAFHSQEVDALFNFIQSFNPNVRVCPASKGSYNGYAYNVYAKVVDLTYTHWCFRRQPNSVLVDYPPAKYPYLLECLHVPLDGKVLSGIIQASHKGILPWPRITIPSGEMGSIKSKRQYDDIQNYLRSLTDQVMSENFNGQKVSPLAFEAFWSD